MKSLLTLLTFTLIVTASACSPQPRTKIDLSAPHPPDVYTIEGDFERVVVVRLKYHDDMLEGLKKAVREEIQKTCVPRPIHTVLAQLEQVKIIITSNYDNLMEEELRKYGRKLTRNVYSRQNSRAAHFNHSPILEEGEVVLHKMHGTIEEPESIVITESDYISYLANLYDKDRGMPEYFRKTWIPFCTLLFLGYGLADWNFRVIWEGVLSSYAQRALRKEAYALVMGSTHFQRKYWSRKNVDVFDQDLTEFAVQLAEHFNLEIPQLGIEKRPQGGSP